MASQAGSTNDYLALRAQWLSHNPADQRRIRQGAGLDHLDYDWRLNEAR